ncbi:MAG: hypothetical protein V3U54_13195 [Thermodesulfobacteriota bacterium]
MTSTEITQHFSEDELRSGFKVANLRAFPSKFSSGEPAIFIGGSYLEFNRVNDNLGVSFSLSDIKRIAQELLTLAQDMEQKILLEKIDSFMKLFEDE